MFLVSSLEMVMGRQLHFQAGQRSLSKQDDVRQLEQFGDDGDFVGGVIYFVLRQYYIILACPLTDHVYFDHARARCTRVARCAMIPGQDSE